MRPQPSAPRLQRLGGHLALASALTYAGVKLSWIEATLIGASFGGIAVGVAIGLPAYVLGRWPWLRSAGRAIPEPSTSPARRARLLTGVAAGIVGTWWLAWGGGPHRRRRRTPADRPVAAARGEPRRCALLSGLLLLGVGATGRPWVTSGALFVGSGSMFAWSCRRLVAAVWHPPGYDAPGALPQYSAAVAASAIALHMVLERFRDSGRTADTARGAPGGAGGACGVQSRAGTIP